MEALDLAAQVKAWAVPRIQYTDVVRKGGAVSPNLPALEAVARSCGLRMTAVGGLSTLDDVRRLRELETLGVDEVVVGKALYEKRFTEYMDKLRREAFVKIYDPELAKLDQQANEKKTS